MKNRPSRPRFEVIEHTADTGFRAWGDTPAELFANAALALESIAVEMGAVSKSVPYPIAASGEDYESLLVNFLNEVLYHLDGDRVVLGSFDVESISPTQVRCLAWGDIRDDAEHPPKVVVKGVTYHLLEVKPEGDGWTARVILDI